MAMVYTQWKQRLYAFLLRRVLGPYLSSPSLTKLHESIEVSLQEGKFTLNDVDLNASYLTLLMSRRGDKCVSIATVRRARIRKLQINLILEETQHGQESPTEKPTSSVAWRAMQLGRGSEATSKVKLMAYVEIEGFDIELEPTESGHDFTPPPRPEAPPPANEASATAGMISSYVDAALTSLRLSLRMKDLRVKLCSSTRDSLPSQWVEFHLATARYHDVDDDRSASSTSKRQQTSYSTVIHKMVDFAGVTLRTGTEVRELKVEGSVSSGEEIASPRMSIIAKTEGNGQISLRVIEYASSTPPMSETEMSSQSSSTKPPRIQQDLEITLNQRLNFSTDHASLRSLIVVSSGFLENKCDSAVSESSSLIEASSHFDSQRNVSKRGHDDVDDDSEDLYTMAGIMKQYAEARHLAERNEMRGGVLIPSTAFVDSAADDDSVTFDAFFDANDHSFSLYQSRLEQSIIASDVADNDTADFLHTKVRFHLQQCGVKLAFPNRVDGELSRDIAKPCWQRVADEYILLTLGNISLTLSLSQKVTDISLDVVHFEIEDSLRDRSMKAQPRNFAPPLAIENVLRFVKGVGDEITEAPCISMHVLMQRGKSSPSTSSMDLMLEPLELVVRCATMSNVLYLISQLNPDETPTKSLESERHEQKNLWRFSASCPSFSLELPFSCDAMDGEGQFSLFDRCGYLLPQSPISRSSSFGLTLDALSVSHNSTASLSCDAYDNLTTGKAATATTTMSCHRVLVFVTSPRMNDGQHVMCMQRADIIASSGHAPILLTYRSNAADSPELIAKSPSADTIESTDHVPILFAHTPSAADNQDSIGRKSFPTVPPLSSFKARQEDEDSDSEGMFSKEFTSLVTSTNASAARASDPQDVMLRVAERCSSVIDLYLPELVGDITRDEAVSLSKMVLAEIANIAKGSASQPESSSDSSTEERPSDHVGFTVSIDQITLTAHQKLDDEIDDVHWYSYEMMAEGFKAHATLAQSRVKTIRVLAHELNFFEVRDLVQAHEIDISATPSFRDRCDNVRRRTFQRGSSIATPIFYRSQLFPPLSPESPTFLVDVFTSDDDLARDEWNVHFTMYSLTHRFDVDSQWQHRFRKLLRVHENAASESTLTKPCAQEAGSMLIKLFVSLADCNIDYTSPEKFSTESQMIVRLSDIRFSSNLVSPPGPSQAFRVSLGDLSILLCDVPHSHNFENARLARASTVLSHNDLAQTTKEMAPDQILRHMNLITMVTLDSMDMMLSLSLHGELNHGDDSASSQSDPLVTVCLTLGILSVYGCKDSFACFTGTLSELQSYVTALDEEAILALKDREPVISVTAGDEGEGGCGNMPTSPESRNALTSLGSVTSSTEAFEGRIFIGGDDFSLGGQDWSTVEHEWSATESIPLDGEQSAKWYSSGDTVDAVEFRAGHHSVDVASEAGSRSKLRIIPNHIPLSSVSDPFNQKDMNAAKYAGTSVAPRVQARILVRDVKKFRCRFFDGYDWPKSKKQHRSKSGAFIINPISPQKLASEKEHLTEGLEERIDDPEANKMLEKRAKLLGDLLDNDTDEGTFSTVPLPEERGEMLEDLAEQRRLARRMNKFFQVSFSSLKLRMDTFPESRDHLLASCMDIKVADFFLAETISSVKPVKLLGEWLNETEHPRDSSDGLLMMKMITWHPKCRITVDNEVANDESQLELEVLPLRAKIDQRAIRFAAAFFSTEDAGVEKEWNGLKVIPPPLFQSFKVKSFKLKVNYSPEKVDVAALRQGCYVELINISPLVDMVLTLQAVHLEALVGFGPNVKECISRWIEDICATQMHKFLANAKPFQPFSSVGGHALDLFVVPWEAYRRGEPLGRAVRTGAASFAGTVAYETLNTTAMLTGYAAQALSSASAPPNAASALPSRPNEIPRGIGETANHALESLARGLETANYKIVIVPYREYRKSGTSGAVRSVMRGIPVAIAAPVGAATEALSYTLLGARNQVRPDIRKEEEANERGLRHDF